MLVMPFADMGNAFSFGGVGGRTAADMARVYSEANRAVSSKVTLSALYLGFWGCRDV